MQVRTIIYMGYYYICVTMVAGAFGGVKIAIFKNY